MQQKGNLIQLVNFHHSQPRSGSPGRAKKTISNPSRTSKKAKPEKRVTDHQRKGIYSSVAFSDLC